MKAYLFDLDGTLLFINMDEFIKEYIKKLSAFVAHKIDPALFAPCLMASTRQMIVNENADLTNEAVFDEHFFASCGVEREELWPLFHTFYEEVFPTLSHFSKSNPLARPLIERLLSKQKKVVVATNAVFPKIAIEARLKWAGVGDLPFDWITSYETSHSCKPNPQYYTEIAERIGVSPEECMMIGNDMQDDMVAGQTGCQTFLVTDYLVDRGKPVYEVNGRGTFAELYQRLGRE
jgi:HAD superfamily hydrolase (TIGR01549 family)